MTNPICDVYLVLDKVYGEGKYLKQSLAETPVEPANAARTTKICYGVLENDLWLERIVAHNAQKPPKRTVKLVLKIALYMLERMEKHDYMVVDCAVDFVKKLGKGATAGFVNAFLRGYTLPQPPAQADEALSFATSTPLWLAKRIRRSYKGEAKEILSAPSHGLCVRFAKNEAEYLTRPHEKTPFTGAYIFPRFVRDNGFFEGDYTFQSVGSVAICTAISPCERLLDACAAPGGKSVLLAAKCKSVTAQELHPHRARLIEQYAGRMNVDNVAVICADASVFNPAFDSAFDGVLCDVPCSGTGVLNENPDIKLFRKEEDIASLMQTQAAILANCARYVKQGGYLYYSTCSVLPEENDSAVYNFLQTHTDFAVEQADSPLAHKKTKLGLQFLPHISHGAGFYFAKLKRL